jgi:putative dimethyl sulfoxide reductase chaperone
MEIKEESTVTTDILLARATLYSYVSSIFSDPSTPRFKRLYDHEFREIVLFAADTIDRLINVTQESLAQPVSDSFSALGAVGGDVDGEYVRIFGHSLSRKTSPYETEHLGNNEIFYKTQCLADLNGFYKAFGLELRSGERADHLSLEAEFMMHLIVKEYAARERNLESEKIMVARDAQRSFWTDHLNNWVTELAGNVAGEAGGGLYAYVGVFVQSLMKKEQVYFSGVNTLCE